MFHIAFFELAKMIWSPLSCVDNFMKEYPWIPCTYVDPDNPAHNTHYTPKYLEFFLTSVAFTILYIVGFIAISAYILIRFRADIQKADYSKIWWFAFLVSEYSPQYFYWELLMISRRLLIALVQTIFGITGLGYSFILVILLFSGLLSSHIQPFKHRTILYLDLTVTFALVSASAISTIFGRVGRYQVYYFFILFLPFLYLIGVSGYKLWKNPKPAQECTRKIQKFVTCAACRRNAKKTR